MVEIPTEIGLDEIIIRGIQSPRTINPKTNQIKSNFFKLKAGETGCSCIRLNYTTIEHAKYHCKIFENIEKACRYVGFVSLKVSEILACKNNYFTASVISTPLIYLTHELYAHCDITYGIVIKEGEPFPEELNEIFEMLRHAASKNIFLDPTPEKENWEGVKIA